MMDDYSRYYAVLRVTHDLDWKALRVRYKRLMGQWHPDRFPIDARDREVAEEHTKEITLAYQAIERYYRDHGVLPPLSATTSPAREAAPRAQPASEVTQPSARAEATPPHAATDARAPRRRRPLAAVLAAILVGTYAVYRFASVGEPDTTETEARVTETQTQPQPRVTPREPGGISLGSTLGEVYAIQGVPTATQGDIWHYGKSSVRFANGKVVSWNQHPDSPLRIARDLPVEVREGVFDVGSTKDEVRAIQGTPVTETETVWDYGPSRVYFERNRVTRWEASPMQPLRVPR
jgi:hypothetical protein